jgi:hypothetical protein
MKAKVQGKRYFYECGGCDHLHPLGWTGDCREDSQRFRTDELPANAIIMDENAPMPPEGCVPRKGVEMGCGDVTCTKCYVKETP